MLKKLIGATYLLIISSLSFATGISTMTGDASLSGTITNWNPAFADGNTIVVGADNISLTADQSVTIRSIRLDHTLKDIRIATLSINLGAVSENGSINDISIAGTKTSNGCTLNLTGAAGEDNNPPANSYTGIKNINFWYESTLFINCPTTLACGFNRDGNNIKSIVYVNDDVLVLSGIGTMTDIIIAKNKTLTIDNNSVLNSHFDFSDLGTLLLSGENTIFNPSTVSNVESAVLNIKNNVTTNMPSVLTINTINISDGKSFTIDALNSDINLLKNNVSVNFIGNNAAIVLTNSANTDRQFTLFTHLNPSSTTDNYGIVKIRAITTGLTIANNAGTYTIGQDNTHRLQNFIVEGSGSIVVDHKVFTGLLSMNSIGQVIFNQALDLGVKGNIAFGVSGKLTLNSDLTGNIDFAGHDGVLQLANGRTIKGNVDSSHEVAGTLEFLGAGTVEGTIGKTNALNTLKFSGAGDITLPKANAKIIEVANAQAKITANDTLEGNVLFSTDGTLIADHGVDGTITTNTDNTGTIIIGGGDVGVIGEDDKKLKQIHLNQTTASSIGKVYASNVNIGGVGPITATDSIKSSVSFSVDGTLIAHNGITGNIDFAGHDGVLQLANGRTIKGNVDSSHEVAGTLEFLGAGTVEGTIGKTNALNTLKFSGAGDITLPKANAKIIEVANAQAKITANDTLEGNVLFSTDGTLIADHGVDGTITTNTDNTGTIIIGGGDVGVIGEDDKKLKQIHLNQTTASSIGKVYASNVNIGGVGPITATDSIKSSVSFSVDGTLIAHNGITGNIDFAGHDGVLQLANGRTIKGNVDSSHEVAGTLEFLGAGTVEGTIGKTNALNTLKFSGAGDITLPKANAKIIEVANAQAKITANDTLEGNVLFSTDGTLIADHGVDGTITTNTDNTGTIIIGGGDVGVIGEDDKKLKQIHLNQTTASSIGKVYASNVNIGGVGPILFNDNIHANNIDIDNSHIGISDNIAIYGNINASNTNILLDHNRLTLRGTNTFANKIIISSTYDEYSLSGGNVILISGSTLDLSNVSSLIIKLSCINSNISKINNTTKYNIILAEDGSNIILLDDPEHHIILDSSGEQNKFVKWTLDVSSLTLYASDDSDTVIDNDYVFDSVQNNTFMQELKNALPSSAAQEFKNNIGLLSKQRVEEMLSRILDYPQERTSDIVRVALHQTLTDANRSAMHAIHNRVFGANLAVVASGDEDVSKYVVWARSSINQSKDKVNSRSAEYFSSYKTRGHSNTIGADGLICDNLLVGAAYTNAYTSIRPKYQNIGNIDKVRTNMFSLYSAYNIPNYNWYLDSIVSYAESSIRGQKIRYLAVARDILGNEVAFSKYKSRLYSGSISLGYYHHIGKDIYVTPSIGMIGSLIRDRGYTESGTSFQNLTVRQKNYSKLSGVAGLRTYQDIYLGNNADSVIVTPEAYGFVNYNIKNKTPAIDARLNGIDKRLPKIIHRSNRIDYNVGLGITIKQNMMEYGINYDTNLAHKYQGHSGSLKVRVNL